MSQGQHQNTYKFIVQLFQIAVIQSPTTVLTASLFSPIARACCTQFDCHLGLTCFDVSLYNIDTNFISCISYT